MNRGTSERSACNSIGNQAQPSVASSNMMTERSFDLDWYFWICCWWYQVEIWESMKNRVPLEYKLYFIHESILESHHRSLGPISKVIWGTLMWPPCVVYLGPSVFRCYQRFAPEFGLWNNLEVQSMNFTLLSSISSPTCTSCSAWNQFHGSRMLPSFDFNPACFCIGTIVKTLNTRAPHFVPGLPSGLVDEQVLGPNSQKALCLLQCKSDQEVRSWLGAHQV